MKFGFAAVAALFAAEAALAAIPLTSTVTVNPGAATGPTLTAIANGAGATASNSSSSPVVLVPISQFNPNTGILLGARVTASVPVTLTTVVTGTVLSSGGDRTVTSTASYTGAVSGPGVSIAGAPISVTRSCSGGNCPNSPSNQTGTATGTIAGTATVGSASLADYYGTGNVGVSTGGSLGITVQNGVRATQGNGDASVTRNAGSSYSVAYDYLNFSQASFNGSTVQSALTLDFGTRILNSGPVTLNFSIYNIGNNNSAGLDLLSVTSQNGNTLFTTTLDPFVDLAGGANRSFTATFNPASLGSTGDRLRLVFKDAANDVGNGLGARETVMDVYYAALMVLPDPGTWMTMILGFGFVGSAMRRRRAAIAA